MQKTRFSKLLSLILCIALIAAIALTASGCNDNSQANTSGTFQTASITDNSVIGEGENSFIFTVTDAQGSEVKCEIHTDKTVVGEALLELNLISGEQDQYGMYVKTVNGITVDFDTDGKYWAFYINGEYAVSGVDSTEITEGATYSFKVE